MAECMYTCRIRTTAPTWKGLDQVCQKAGSGPCEASNEDLPGSRLDIVFTGLASHTGRYVVQPRADLALQAVVDHSDFGPLEVDPQHGERQEERQEQEDLPGGSGASIVGPHVTNGPLVSQKVAAIDKEVCR